MNGDRGDLVQSRGIEPLSSPGGQGLEAEMAQVQRSSWLWLCPSDTDLPTAEAPEVPQEVRNRLDFPVRHGYLLGLVVAAAVASARVGAHRALIPNGQARDIDH